MQSRTMVLGFAVLGYALMFASLPVAQAGGVGACVAGNGFDFADDSIGVFVGVNVGPTDPTNPVHMDQAGFEAACCADAGLPADCFNPVN